MNEQEAKIARLEEEIKKLKESAEYWHKKCEREEQRITSLKYDRERLWRKIDRLTGGEHDSQG